MITKQQAINVINRMFHHNVMKNSDGTCQRWRRNGKTKTWKSQAFINEFEIPIKHGLRDYNYITPRNADTFHLASECTNEKQ